MKSKISVVISAYNEESTIERCLKSVAFADEFIVVDNTSLDRTVEISKKYTTKIFSQPNRLMLNTNKNFGFAKATGDWILNLDADEEIPEKLAEEICNLVKSNPIENGFWIKRKNFSFGKWIQNGLWWPDKQVRLFRRGNGKFPCVHIHEYIQIDGAIGELIEPYMHHNYESIHQYLGKIDRASTSEALNLQESKYQLAWFDAIRFPVSDFLKIYFAQHGYRDGIHGLVLALLQAFYSFCVFAKYWEMAGFTQFQFSTTSIASEFAKAGKEIRYWLLTMGISEAPDTFGKLRGKIMRKFIRVDKK